MYKYFPNVYSSLFASEFRNSFHSPIFRDNISKYSTFHFRFNHTDDLDPYQLSMYIYKKSIFNEKYSTEDFPIVITHHGWLFAEINITSTVTTRAAILNHIDCYIRTQRKHERSMSSDVSVIDNM